MEQQDFEDISLAPGTEEGREVIYVGDIGNNWDKHCRGSNSPNKTLYMFSEPKMEDYKWVYEFLVCLKQTLRAGSNYIITHAQCCIYSIHPCFGFLAENAKFAKKIIDNNNIEKQEKCGVYISRKMQKSSGYL